MNKNKGNGGLRDFWEGIALGMIIVLSVILIYEGSVVKKSESLSVVKNNESFKVLGGECVKWETVGYEYTFSFADTNDSVLKELKPECIVNKFMDWYKIDPNCQGIKIYATYEKKPIKKCVEWKVE